MSETQTTANVTELLRAGYSFHGRDAFLGDSGGSPYFWCNAPVSAYNHCDTPEQAISEAAADYAERQLT